MLVFYRSLVACIAITLSSVSNTAAMDADFLRFSTVKTGVEMARQNFRSAGIDGVPNRRVYGVSWTDGTVFGGVEAEIRSDRVQGRPSGERLRLDSRSTLSVLAGLQAAEGFVIYGRVGVEQAKMEPGPQHALMQQAPRGTFATRGMRFALGVNYSLGDQTWMRAELGRSAYTATYRVEAAEDMGVSLSFVHRF